MKVVKNAVLWLVCLVVFCSVAEAEYEPVGGKIMTRWAAEVKPGNVHGEYPRPMMVRDEWLNLNGLWEYGIMPKDTGSPAESHGEILVPFCVESALSGVQKTVKPNEALWYLRSFEIAKGWSGKNILLHFGAVDWETVVWVNGKRVGYHQGGYDAFTFDITEALQPEGRQVIAVKVTDPTDKGYQPRGKQVLKPKGIWYTAVTGIWQTVWLEPVPKGYIRSVKITPDIDRQIVVLNVDAVGISESQIEAEAMLDGFSGKAELSGKNEFTIKIPNPKLWSPDSPSLYKLRIKGAGDSVESYFGMRKIEMKKDEAGVNRLFLNNEVLFQYGPLDQGWWPDGLYTAPSDEALRYDIEVTKKLGMNMLRKHVKVEPARFYYWCDKLGMLVWQDMPSGDKYIRGSDPDIKRSKESAGNFVRELKAMIDGLYNQPSIVMWVPYNEGWGQWDTERITKLVKWFDPTRLVNSASGWTDRKVGDVNDIHKYPGPAIPPLEDERAAVLGEFGGLGLPVKGHTWQDEKNWGYRSYKTSEELTDAYVSLIGKLRPLIGEGLCAAVYTQTTDVEIEVNGLMTYDRALIKMDADKAAEANRKLYLPPPIIKTIMPTSQTEKQTWQFSLDNPGDGWEKTDFDDSGWKSGAGGFGSSGTPGAVIGTEWKGSDIWLRRSFELEAVPDDWQLLIHHDNDAEVYINGELVKKVAGYTISYGLEEPGAEAAGVLRAGRNVLAVHCSQVGGGQFIDVGLVAVTEGRWSSRKAQQWYEQQPWLVGCNFIPSTAINQLEMWQGDTFDPKTIERELGWAAKLGFNVVRVYLHDLAYDQDPDGFLRRMDMFLGIASAHGIKPLFVIFDDCWLPDPKIGKQPEPWPGVHNSGWLESPGLEQLKRYSSDAELRRRLEKYVKAVLTRFREDDRVLMWDLYNEPGGWWYRRGDKPGDFTKGLTDALCVGLLKDAYRWARQVDPSQPLTSCWNRGAYEAEAALDWADVVTFHHYGKVADLEELIGKLRQSVPNRPMICTEYLARDRDSRFQSHLPVFRKQRIGAINWGLVAGKTNTMWGWDSWNHPGGEEPKEWFHDILRKDGSPYDAEEVKFIQQIVGGQ
ncbi:MAG: cellulase family glycosylhydrolase [Sedimentisphaerales bacterium]|nr:cellulase family glycosylhydrolase [Sedimentisphaerales bacterium]